jgi:valyl-tRNA synthetase
VHAQRTPGERLRDAAWPVADAAWSAPDAEATVAAMQQWCVSLRETRARYQVQQKERLTARFQADGEAAAVLRSVSPLLAHMSGLGAVEIGPDVQRTKDAATVVLGAAKAYLLGVVDLEAEKRKLAAQQEKLRGQIAGIEKKLQNEGFVQKAPPEVVEKERAGLAALKTQLAGVDRSLRELG